MNLSIRLKFQDSGISAKNYYTEEHQEKHKVTQSLKTNFYPLWFSVIPLCNSPEKSGQVV